MTDQIPELRELPLTSYAGIIIPATHVTIGKVEIPAKPSPRTVLVWGTIESSSLNLYAVPPLMDVEVRLGDPVSGELIASGLGRSRNGVSVATVVPRIVTLPADTESQLYVNLVHASDCDSPILLEFTADNSNSALFAIEVPTKPVPEYEKALSA